MKSIICAFSFCIIFKAALALDCQSCIVGPECSEVINTCSAGESSCISVTGTVNGEPQHYKDCATSKKCNDCKLSINATDCKATCCNTDNCNAKPTTAPPTTTAPPPPTTTLQPATTTSPPTTTTSPPTTTPPTTQKPTTTEVQPETTTPTTAAPAESDANIVTDARNVLATATKESAATGIPDVDATTKADTIAPSNATQASVTPPVAKAVKTIASAGIVTMNLWALVSVMVMGFTVQLLSQ